MLSWTLDRIIYESVKTVHLDFMLFVDYFSSSNIWTIFLYPVSNNISFEIADLVFGEAIVLEPVKLPIWAHY